MATMKVIQCREHGGQFSIPSRRGRPPVRCTDENPCDMVKTKRTRNAQAVANRTAETLKGKLPTSGGRRPSEIAMAAVERGEIKKARSKSTLPKQAALRTSKWCSCDEQGGKRHERGIEGCKYATRNGAVIVKHNPSVPLAMHAREQLEPLGWSLTGRAWFDQKEAWSEVTGTRGDETIIIRWLNGKLADQHYSIWDSEKVSTNGRPKSRLPFDPDALSDMELANELRGRQVTWWNRIAKSTEKAIIGDKLQIQHNYDEGKEHARMVLFVNHGNTGGFRAFHVEALMKVV